MPDVRQQSKRERGAMPLHRLPRDMVLDVLAQVPLPRPPARWLNLGLAQIESRAWYEWHWARGRAPGQRRSTVPPDVRWYVIERDEAICGICGYYVDPEDIHIDHVIPVALGGSDDPVNLQVAHALCNMRKGARV